MTTPLHYQHSDTYLRTHISRISRGIVLAGLFGISAFVAAAGIYSLAAHFIN